jgi:hypothetical protein
MGVVIIDAAARQDGFVAGAAARGEFRCAGCGYGIVVHRGLPVCPMCHAGDWHPWSSRRPVHVESRAADPARA